MNETITWRSVEDELPATWIDVLCWDEASESAIIRAWDGTDWVDELSVDFDCIVNYWADMLRGPVESSRGNHEHS